jgi:hypothetical protein
MRILCLALICALAMSCKKSDPAPTAVQASVGTTYLIMNNDAQGTSGGISTYVFETSTLKSNAWASSALADMVTDNGKLYVSAKNTKTIDFLDPKSLSSSKSPAFGKDTKNFPNFIYKHVVVAAGKIFISDQVNVSGSNKSFLKAMSISDPSKVDSISISAEAAIVSLQAVGNKIFASTLGYFYNNSELFVIDASSYSILAKINMTPACSQLSVDNDNNIMAIQTGSLLRISATDYSIIKTPFGGTPLIESTAGTIAASSAALNKETNIIYYLGQAPQPASAPYVLAAYDLSLKTSKVLNTSFISATTIAFDKKNKVIIVGSGNFTVSAIPDPGPDKGAITFYNTDGAILRKVTMPKVPEKILILE